MHRVFYRLLVGLAGLAVRSGRSKDIEIMVLRHQLAVLRRQSDRPKLTDADPSLLGAIAQALPRSRRAGWLVTPDTLLRWHRRRIARHWIHPRRSPGRPATAIDLQHLIIRMAAENPTRGYRRIHGELLGLGHHVAASTVWQILKNSRVGTAPDRAAVTWTQFPRSEAAVACDFATVDTIGDAPLLPAVLHRHHDPRGRPRGDHCPSHRRLDQPGGPQPVLRHGGRLANARALVRDRGSQFVAAFDEIFITEGIRVLRTPVATPVAHAFAERWIGSLRRELLDRTIIWNRSQLERLVVGYTEHYNHHRPHRSLHQQPPFGPKTANVSAPLLRHAAKTTCCNGLINQYRNAA